ncbi:hypothetical protein D3C71_1262530 [compost metagenome]
MVKIIYGFIGIENNISSSLELNKVDLALNIDTENISPIVAVANIDNKAPCILFSFR